MLNRDFTKSKKEYLLKNKTSLIVMLCFLVVGILFLSIWGLNLNPEFVGCKRVEIAIGKEASNSDLDDYTTKISSILNDNSCSLYTLSLKGEGNNSILEVKYSGKTNDEKIKKINNAIASDLEVSLSNISEHEKVSKTVSSTDYVYTALACLLIVIFSMIFVWARHNLAYAISMLTTNAFAFVSLIFAMAILRVEIGASFFFMIVATIVFTTFASLILFENMREVRKDKKYKSDFSKQLTLGFKNMSKELQFSSIGLFVLGFLFVLFGTAPSRLIALTFMFSVLVSLMSFVFIMPLVYNLTIDKAKFKQISDGSKDSKKTDDKSELTNNETETSVENAIENEAEGNAETLENKENEKAVNLEENKASVNPSEEVNVISSNEEKVDEADNTPQDKE